LAPARVFLRERAPALNYRERVTTRSISTFLLAALLACFAIGCSRDCEDYCEDEKDCDTGDKSIDCATNCDDAKKLNELASCEDQYADLLNCKSNTDDICRVGDTCEAEANRWQSCLVKYCNDPDVDHTEDCD
jgi:hypothetical protein